MEPLQKFVKRSTTRCQGVGVQQLDKYQIITYIHYYIGIDCGFWFILHYLLQISFAKNKHITSHTYIHLF